MQTATEPAASGRTLCYVPQALLALNVGFAAGWWALVSMTWRDDSLSRFPLLFRAAAAANRLIRYPGQYSGETPGWAIIYGALALIFALMLLGLLGLLQQTGAIRRILDPWSGIIALAAVPTSWLVTHSSAWPVLEAREITVPELAVACALIFLTRKHPARAGYLWPLLVLHYTIWAGLLIEWSELRIPALILPPYLASVGNSIAWAVYASRMRQLAGAPGSSRSTPEPST